MVGTLGCKEYGWVRSVLFFFSFIFGVGLFEVVGYLTAGVDIAQPVEMERLTTEQHFIIMAFSLLGLLLVTWVFMRFVDKKPLFRLGFTAKNRNIDIIIGLLLGFVIMFVAYGLLVLLGEIQFVEVHLDLKQVFLLFFVFLFGAIIEEVLCRGYVLRNLMQCMNKYVALIVSSLFFSLLHIINPNIDIFNLCGLFLAGIVFGLLYMYTKNLWLPIMFHMSWNLFQSLLGFNVSGLDFYSIVEFKVSSPNRYLNGGNFGFEGSVFSILIELLLIIATFVLFKKNLKHQNVPII